MCVTFRLPIVFDLLFNLVELMSLTPKRINMSQIIIFFSVSLKIVADRTLLKKRHHPRRLTVNFPNFLEQYLIFSVLPVKSWI